ncbi:PepSY domain-containing protein [uncultured Roseobacter sp.]|uniref:PepSY domain-containing protein n=1 Tax=uncultured Roseobacter sp. TaxID=114847 RepID=UPI002616C9A1|nr:PepSY domain-containing protein [uncultured Roseobacter sp.]
MTFFKSLALTACIAVPGYALAQTNLGDAAGKTGEDVAAYLTGLGYSVIEVEAEDDEIEVSALLDGVEYEIEVSSQTGLVIEMGIDDDETEEN